MTVPPDDADSHRIGNPNPAGGAGDIGGGDGSREAAGKPSGLRNPPAAVRGAGAGALAAMAVILLMGIVPLIRLDAPAAAVIILAVLAVVAIVLCGLLKRPWTWWAATAIPVALLATSFLHTALGVLGVMFALLWAYILYVRRSVLR